MKREAYKPREDTIKGKSKERWWIMLVWDEYVYEGKKETKPKHHKNTRLTRDTTRPWCGTTVLIGTGRPCHIAAPPWLCSSCLARLGMLEGEMFARLFGIV